MVFRKDYHHENDSKTEIEDLFENKTRIIVFSFVFIAHYSKQVEIGNWRFKPSCHTNNKHNKIALNL